MTTKQKYDKAFKLNSIELLLSSNKSQAQLSKELGVRQDLLSRWKKEYLLEKEGAFPGKGRLSPEKDHIMKLQKELSEVKMERDILKKAVAIFSRKQ